MPEKQVIVKGQKALAETFGVHLRTIGGWHKRGIPREGGSHRGQTCIYDIEKVKDWLRQDTLQRNMGRPKLPVLLPPEGESIKAQLERERGIIEWYKGNYATLLKKRQIDAWTFIDKVEILLNDRMADMSDKDLIRLRETLWTSFGIAYDKERLELDLSTENIAVLYQRAQKLKEDDLKRDTA